MRTFVPRLRDTCKRLGRDAIGFVYVPVCVRCRDPLTAEEDSFAPKGAGDPDRFCQSCFELLSCSVERACQRCGAPVGPYLDTVHGCRHCRRDRFHFDHVLALGVYEHQLRECCTRAKQPFEEPLAAGLTELLWQAHESEWPALNIDLVVPVPHHWTDRIARRHLPPVTMSKVLSRRLMVPQGLHILAKVRRTRAQAALTPARRRTNLRDAFRVAGGARLDGLTVLITDDILTTGTTVDRAAQVLRRAGAARVIGAVLARGLGQSAR